MSILVVNGPLMGKYVTDYGEMAKAVDPTSIPPLSVRASREVAPDIQYRTVLLRKHQACLAEKNAAPRLFEVYAQDGLPVPDAWWIVVACALGGDRGLILP